MRMLFSYFSSLRFNILYFLFIPLLGFTLLETYWIRHNPFDTASSVKNYELMIKRIYFTVLFLISAILLNHMDSGTIEKLGKNSLGLSNEIWLLIMIYIAGITIYYLIVSDAKLKELSFKDTKVVLTSDESDNIESLINRLKSTINESSQLIEAEYTTMQQIPPIAIELKKQLKKRTAINYLQELKNIIDLYCGQIDGVIECFVIKKDNIDTMDFNNQEEILESINSVQGIIFKKYNVQYFLIPFNSKFGDSLIVGIKFLNEPLSSTQYIILNMLERFEDLIMLA